MNWKAETENDLKVYQRRKESLENMRQAICLLEDDYCAPKSFTTGRTPVQGGASTTEDWMIRNIMKRERLERNIKTIQSWVEWMEQGLRSLNAQQWDILNEFYMMRTPGYIERLMERYHVERERVYQLKDQALYDLTITLYGICDL